MLYVLKAEEAKKDGGLYAEYYPWVKDSQVERWGEVIEDFRGRHDSDQPSDIELWIVSEVILDGLSHLSAVTFRDAAEYYLNCSKDVHLELMTEAEFTAMIEEFVTALEEPEIAKVLAEVVCQNDF